MQYNSSVEDHYKGLLQRWKYCDYYLPEEQVAVAADEVADDFHADFEMSHYHHRYGYCGYYCRHYHH
jgi:hypothetical protein